jgi:hypothetical protein
MLMKASDTPDELPAPRKRPSGRKRALIAGGAIALSVATGPLWAQPSDGASACGNVNAGRAGTINTCNIPKNTHTDDVIEKVIGTTTTGCVVGFVFGLGAGLLPGCVGGLVGNIAW